MMKLRRVKRFIIRDQNDERYNLDGEKAFHFATKDLLRYLTRRRGKLYKDHTIVCPGKLEIVVSPDFDNSRHYWKMMAETSEGIYSVIEGYVAFLTLGGQTFIAERADVFVDDRKDLTIFYVDMLLAASNTIWDSMGLYGKWRRFVHICLSKSIEFLT